MALVAGTTVMCVLAAAWETAVRVSFLAEFRSTDLQLTCKQHMVGAVRVTLTVGQVVRTFSVSALALHQLALLLFLHPHFGSHSMVLVVVQLDRHV
jgi:hypothetical protein